MPPAMCAEHPDQAAVAAIGVSTVRPAEPRCLECLLQKLRRQAAEAGAALHATALPVPVQAAPVGREWGWQIADDSLGRGDYAGHVTQTFDTRDHALIGDGRHTMHIDSRVAWRDVGPWQDDDGQDPR